MADSLPIEMTYADVLNQITRFYGSNSDPWNEIVIRSDSANPTRIAEEYLQEAGIKVIRTPSGRNVTYARSTVLDSYSSSPISTSNSNTQTATMGGNAKRALINGTATTTTEASTKTTTFQKGAKAVGTGSRVMTAVSEVSWLTMAASLGGRLGVMVGDELYEHGASWAWTKQDWADFLANDADDLDKAVLSFLTGVNPNGNSTEYMDEKALAQMYMLLRSMGYYDPSEHQATIDDTTELLPNYIPQLPINFMENQSIQAITTNTGANYLTFNIVSAQSTVYTMYGLPGSNVYLMAISDAPFTLSYTTGNNQPVTVQSNSYTNGNLTVYYYTRSAAGYSSKTLIPPIPVVSLPNVNQYGCWNLLYIIKNGVITGGGGVDGLSKDPNATTYIDPSLVDGQDRDTVLQQLKQNYPELFADSIYQDVPQDDGTDERITYVPVPYVKPSTKPVTGSNHQNNPSVNTETNTDTELEDLIKLITQLFTPDSIPDTGDGNTPPTVIPVGSASSLWKIYNPTQAQIDSFGSWLWSSNLVDQIKKLFNDPMQAIIGVHKVFATPSVGGTATIKVGYLDSEVSSNWVDNQYTTVNCGSASLKEYFGNVFDYAPYTKVQLYLPFIGIVDLDIGDVMRSTISVVYHVDVLTGACLADVKVNRDGVGGVLYQYAGSAIVTYPVSAGNYMGMLAGVLSVAGGIAGTILSGGALAPALIGGAVGASHLHTDVSHSGGFSGCAGAMGSKKPYLIVSRPQIAMADNYQHYTGIPANSKVTLGNCNGYAKVKSVYVNSITRATEDEKNMIEAQLKAGVLV